MLYKCTLIKEIDMCVIYCLLTTITIGHLNELDIENDGFGCYFKEWHNCPWQMTFQMLRRQLTVFCLFWSESLYIVMELVSTGPTREQ